LALFLCTGIFADTADTEKDRDEVADSETEEESNVEGTPGRRTRRDAEEDVRVCEKGAEGEVEKKEEVVEEQAEVTQKTIEGSRHRKRLLREH